MKTKKLRIIKDVPYCSGSCISYINLYSAFFQCFADKLLIWAGLCGLSVIYDFFMSMFWEHKYDARDVDNKEIHITQELLKERNKWGSFL